MRYKFGRQRRVCPFGTNNKPTLIHLIFFNYIIQLNALSLITLRKNGQRYLLQIMSLFMSESCYNYTEYVSHCVARCDKQNNSLTPLFRQWFLILVIRLLNLRLNAFFLFMLMISHSIYSSHVAMISFKLIKGCLQATIGRQRTTSIPERQMATNFRIEFFTSRVQCQYSLC